jgi:hypothetical protein
MARIIEPEVDRRMNDIQSDITSRLNQDFAAYQSTTQPSATAPSTRPAGGFASFEYLQKLAADVQARRKVTLRVASFTDEFRSREQLDEIEGIGKATYRNTPFGTYATIVAAPFVSETSIDKSEVLDLYEPSRPMSDLDRNTYIYRITAAEKTHKPATMDEVKEQVEKDWRRARAFDLAKADAQKLADEAKKVGLKEAAGDSVIIAGPFSSASMGSIENYNLPITATDAFIRQAFELVPLVGEGASTSQPSSKPVGVIELPDAGRVAVAEVIYVDSVVKPEAADMAHAIFSQSMSRELAMALTQQWFDYENVAQRVGFKSNAAGATR